LALLIQKWLLLSVMGDQCGHVHHECCAVFGDGGMGDIAIRISMLSLRNMPPNKPLQRTIPPQGHWCNINEPLVRRARR
jgi:hypothetical protein